MGITMRALPWLALAVVFVLVEGDKEAADLAAVAHGDELGDTFSKGLSVKVHEALEVDANTSDEKQVEELLDSHADDKGRLIDSFHIDFSDDVGALGEEGTKPANCDTVDGTSCTKPKGTKKVAKNRHETAEETRQNRCQDSQENAGCQEGREE